jgi:hypothetical protein
MLLGSWSSAHVSKHGSKVWDSSLIGSWVVLGCDMWALLEQSSNWSLQHRCGQGYCSSNVQSMGDSFGVRVCVCSAGLSRETKSPWPRVWTNPQWQKLQSMRHQCAQCSPTNYNIISICWFSLMGVQILEAQALTGQQQSWVSLVGTYIATECPRLKTGLACSSGGSGVWGMGTHTGLWIQCM